MKVLFLSKCTVLTVDLLKDERIFCFQACMCVLFSPETVQTGTLKGLPVFPVHLVKHHDFKIEIVNFPREKVFDIRHCHFLVLKCLAEW